MERNRGFRGYVLNSQTGCRSFVSIYKITVPLQYKFLTYFQGLLGTKAFKALHVKASHYQQPEFSCHLLFSPFSTPFATGEYFLNVCCKDAATTFKKRGSSVFSVWDSKITNFKLQYKFLVCFLVCFILEMTPIKLPRAEIYITSLNIDFWDRWLHG